MSQPKGAPGFIRGEHVTSLALRGRNARGRRRTLRQVIQPAVLSRKGNNPMVLKSLLCAALLCAPLCAKAENPAPNPTGASECIHGAIATSLWNASAEGIELARADTPTARARLQKDMAKAETELMAAVQFCNGGK